VVLDHNKLCCEIHKHPRKMIVYRDIISGDELFTDTIKFEVIEGVLFKVRCRMIKVVESGDYNIGANASQEEQAEEMEADVQQGLDLVLRMKLEEAAPFGKKKDYMVYLKDYCKALNKHEDISDEDKALLKDNLQKSLKPLLENFKNLVFYNGESRNPESMLAILNWENDDSEAYMYFIKQGCVEEKV